MIVQVSLGFGVANFIQYATYMASRAYLSGARDKDAQKNAAKAVLETMLQKNGADRYKNIAKASGEGEPTGAMIGSSPQAVAPAGSSDARDKNWEQGVTYKFKMRLYMMPVLKAGNGKGNEVELESQSWLGREPTRDECQKAVKGVEDNGC